MLEATLKTIEEIENLEKPKKSEKLEKDGYILKIHPTGTEPYC